MATSVCCKSRGTDDCADLHGSPHVLVLHGSLRGIADANHDRTHVRLALLRAYSDLLPDESGHVRYLFIQDARRSPERMMW